MEVFTIAELAKNHHGDMGLAKKLMYAAKEGGFDAVKLQAYDIEKMNREHPNYERYKKCWLSMDQLHELAYYAHELNLSYHLSVFNRCLFKEAATFTKIVKIPSTYAHNTNFLLEAHEHFRDVHISHGMGSYPQYNIFKHNQVHYHCVSEYPALGAALYNGSHDSYLGYSDHTIGFQNMLYAYVMGKKYLEKHFNTVDDRKPWEMDIIDAQAFHKKLEAVKENVLGGSNKDMATTKLFFMNEFPGEFE